MLNAQLCRPYREITCCRNPTIHSTTLRSNNNTNTVYKQLGRPYSPLLILNDDWYYYRTSQLLPLATQYTEVLQENTVSFEQPCTPARPPNCHIATATPQLASNTDIAGFSPLPPPPSRSFTAKSSAYWCLCSQTWRGNDDAQPSHQTKKQRNPQLKQRGSPAPEAKPPHRNNRLPADSQSHNPKASTGGAAPGRIVVNNRHSDPTKTNSHQTVAT